MTHDKSSIEMLGVENDLIEAMKRLIEAAGKAAGGVVLIGCGAWVFGRSMDVTADVNIFSARLMARDSVEADWVVLGSAVRLAGVPETTPMPATIETSPNANHYWVWKSC